MSIGETKWITKLGFFLFHSLPPFRCAFRWRLLRTTRIYSVMIICFCLLLFHSVTTSLPSRHQSDTVASPTLIRFITILSFFLSGVLFLFCLFGFLALTTLLDRRVRIERKNRNRSPANKKQKEREREKKDGNETKWLHIFRFILAW